MKILNFGSLNLDFVYEIDRFIQPGETKHAQKLTLICGGKGLNQSVALSYAGAKVYHAGYIGQDGQVLIDRLNEADVRTDFIRKVDSRSGHAVIQVDENGQNSILLYGGANQMISEAYVDEVLSHFEKGDVLLLQNEINLIGYILRQAKKKNMIIAFNAAPMDDTVRKYPLEVVDYLFVNEIEGSLLSNKADFSDIAAALANQFPNCGIVLTMGAQGVIYKHKNGEEGRHPAYAVPVTDTTGAGDTFVGYFLKAATDGLPIEEVLAIASKASALCVMKNGASISIPTCLEVQKFGR